MAARCPSLLPPFTQMYSTTRKMPSFFSENQGMQTLVNLVVSASTAKLSR